MTPGEQEEVGLNMNLLEHTWRLAPPEALDGEHHKDGRDIDLDLYVNLYGTWSF